jgi:hypothetical protein
MTFYLLKTDVNVLTESNKQNKLDFLASRKSLTKREGSRIKCTDPSIRIRIRNPDPHHINADPDPPLHFDAVPDSTFNFGADPDPASHNDADPTRLFIAMRNRIRKRTCYLNPGSGGGGKPAHVPCVDRELVQVRAVGQQLRHLGALHAHLQLT